MALILNIETATKNCTVSLALNSTVISAREINTGNYSHAEHLHQFIAQVMLEADKSFQELNAIAVSKGPGSYTGLRIGVSTAKGLAFAQNIPLISINTLKTLALQVVAKYDFIIPLLDARRMEVYTQTFDSNFNPLTETTAVVIDENSFTSFLDRGQVLFLGDGAEKCKAIIKHANANFLDNHFPSAIQMASLSEEKYAKKQFENTAYFEPFYLKDFVGIKLKDRIKK